ncbi:ferredoxin [Halomicrobium sp. LC1Hm]|uniref:(2Fe-2S) ferredoxin domain-containing protein n=1 Tax=Halomicrobium sp. LC1Hm TaxID=2610902 RepID=UPI0012985805|nr:(2Fe-2S) ferredoxin domain-containing protein [Halomicrobium sp. LC1Hm]QGA82246.1 Sirohydrochlorin iron chelatase fused to [2Fe-2S] Ferredoxin [Halomicrobium sp. LC1Hm]
MEERTAEVHERGFSDHVLVCTNGREEHACCGEAGGEAVFDAVVVWLRERDLLWSRVYVAETGCLGLCSADGAAIAVHPRSNWYADVRPDEVAALLAEEFGPDGSRLGVPAD